MGKRVGGNSETQEGNVKKGLTSAWQQRDLLFKAIQKGLAQLLQTHCGPVGGHSGLPLSWYLFHGTKTKKDRAVGKRGPQTESRLQRDLRRDGTFWFFCVQFCRDSSDAVSALWFSQGKGRTGPFAVAELVVAKRIVANFAPWRMQTRTKTLALSC